MKIKEIQEFINTLKVGGNFTELKKNGEVFINTDRKIYNKMKNKQRKEWNGKVEFYLRMPIIYIKRISK